MSESHLPGYRIDRSKLHPQHPTHLQPPEFWESLGRAVGAFGHLERTLGRAIFVLTGSREAPLDQAARDAALVKWNNQIQVAISGNLSPLIDLFASALLDHPGKRIENAEELVADLRGVVDYRNMVCHSSWEQDPIGGASKPFHVSRSKGAFDTLVGRDLLDRLRALASDLACGVIDAVTSMGYRFPGSIGPGKPIW